MPLGLFWIYEVERLTNEINSERIAKGLKPLDAKEVSKKIWNDEGGRFKNASWDKRESMLSPFKEDIKSELKAARFAAKKVPKGSISGIIDDVAKMATKPAAVAAGAAGIGMEMLRDRKNRMEAIEAADYKPQFMTSEDALSSMKMRDVMTNAKGMVNPISAPKYAPAAINAGLAVLSMADQAAAASGAYGDSYLDKEYGRSDTFSLRTLYDMIGNLPTYGTEGARQRYQSMVNNPEWVERNPIGAVFHNLPNPANGFQGNYYYPRAFADAYTPENLARLNEEMFRQAASQPRPQYNPLSSPMR